MPILGMNVPVHNPENGRTVVLHRGTDVPRHVVGLIKESNVWASEEDAAEAAAILEAVDAEGGSAEETEAGAHGAVEPPRAGAGSGRDSWAIFAAEHHVPVEDEDKRDDIIVKLADAGVIDE